MNGAVLRPEKPPPSVVLGARPGARGAGPAAFHGAEGGPPRAARRRLGLGALAALGALGAASLLACGASIQAVYEGDVRFEHCMALDDEPDVKLAIKRACWHEWISFYTYGQTRDRVRHAQNRIRQLNGTSAFAGGPGSGPTVTEPLEAPVPGDGVAIAEGGGPPAATATGRSPRPGAQHRECLEECEALQADCSDQCRTYGCEKSCAMDYRSCLERCTP
jgi:hypothetical protein